MQRTFRSRRKAYGQLLEHVRRQPHRECCGILAGQAGLITQAFPAKNVAADPVRNYEIAPKEVRILDYRHLGGGGPLKRSPLTDIVAGGCGGSEPA
jgi:proteasome lid subunit RPN8/RPN11